MVLAAYIQWRLTHFSVPFSFVRSSEKLSPAKVRELVDLLLYACMGHPYSVAVWLWSLSEAVLCFLTGPDVEDIAQVLADVPNWKGLANRLNIRSNDIETNCALGVAQASCYRRELVHRYCNRQQSENPSKVAEDVAEALEQMNHNLQAQQLRNLQFGKSVTINVAVQRVDTECHGGFYLENTCGRGGSCLCHQVQWIN